jgi:hypothetical protein
MRTARELFPEAFKDTYSITANYQVMLEEFGKIVLQVDDANCAGDSRVLYQDGDMFGWLQFGWGSCTGCDALQRCETIEEVQNLMNRLQADIKWFDNWYDADAFFRNHAWKTDYSNNAKQKEFIAKALVLFNEIPLAEIKRRGKLARDNSRELHEKLAAEQECTMKTDNKTSAEDQERMTREIVDDHKLDQLNMGLRFGKHEEAKAAYNLEEAKKLQAIICAFPEQPLAIITAVKEYVDNFEEIHKQIKSIRDNFNDLVTKATKQRSNKDGTTTKTVSSSGSR